jgi:hypothetical protein
MEGETGAGACEGRGRSWSGAPPAEISWCVQVWKEGMRRERLERNMERTLREEATGRSKRCDNRHSYSHTKNTPNNRPQVIDHRWQLHRKTEWTTKMLQNPKTYQEKASWKLTRRVSTQLILNLSQNYLKKDVCSQIV